MEELISQLKDLLASAQLKITKCNTQKEAQDRREAEQNSREENIKTEEARLKDLGILEKSVAWVNEQIEILNGKINNFNNDKVVWDRERQAKEKELNEGIVKNQEREKQLDKLYKDIEDSQAAVARDRKEYQAKVIESVNKQLKLKGITL